MNSYSNHGTTIMNPQAISRQISHILVLFHGDVFFKELYYPDANENNY